MPSDVTTDMTFETDAPVSRGLSSWESWRDEVPAVGGILGVVSLVLLGIEAVVGIWLRFSAPSPLWLDETLTVNIAKLPLSQLHQALKQDGAPPLYYLILHVWISIFGSSNLAVRSLSGIISLGTLAVLFVVVRRVWGREVALFTTALLLGSSFAIYYATETRMYSLVMFLCALGGLALVRLFERPSWRSAGSLAVVLICLEYTHYWSFYLFIVLGTLLVGAAWRGAGERQRRAGLLGLGGFGVAAVAFLPWLPTFLYQQKHTGTPWGGPPQFPTLVVAAFHFNHNQMRQVPLSGLAQRVAELVMVILFFLALFAVARGRFGLGLRWRTVPRARVVAWLSFGTMVVGLLASHYGNAAFAPRYASVAYLPLLVFLALGTRALGEPALRVVAVGILAFSTLAVAIQQRSTPRTQALGVVHALEAHAPAGSVVLFCPDQLGPSVARVMPAGKWRASGFPRFDDPNFVNWVDYNKTLESTDLDATVLRLEAMSQSKPIFLVTAPGYVEAGVACKGLRIRLNAAMPHTTILVGDPTTYFQSMAVTEYRPAG